MLYGLLAAVVVPFSLSWMTYNPLVQTFLARMAASYLSQKLNTLVRIDGMYITPRLDLNMSGVLVLDQNADTLFNAGDVFMDMKRFRLKTDQKLFAINDISIHEASFTLLKGRNDSVFSYNFIRDHFETESQDIQTDTIHGQPDWRVSLHGLDLEKVRFRYKDENKAGRYHGMDYADLDVFVDVLKMHDLAIHNDTFNFYIEKLAAREKCGFVLEELSGDFRLSPLFLIADSLHILTPGSDLFLDLAFHYNGWPSYIYFTDAVNIRSRIRPSELNMKDIGCFAPDMMAMDNKLRIGGGVNGRVSNLKVEDFRFAFGSNTRFHGDVRLYGLPDVTETYIHTSIREFSMTADDVGRFAIPGEYPYIPVPEELEVFGTMRIEGSFTGFYNDFVSTAEFASDIGTITTDVSLRQNEQHTDVVYNGAVSARNFHLGKFLNLDRYFGEMDLDAMVTGSGLTGSTVKIDMNGNIDSLRFMGNTFNELAISGEIADRKFNGQLEVQDDMIGLDFNGILDFDQPKPLFDFTADIRNADLFNLNMLNRDSLSMLSAKLNCNFIGLDLDDLEGRVYIDSMEYLEGDKQWVVQHLALASIKDTGYHRRITLYADFMDAAVSGNYTYRELRTAISEQIRKEMNEWAFADPPQMDIRPQNLDFEVRVKDTRQLSDIFVPGLYVEENSIITGRLDLPGSLIEMNASIPSLSYAGVHSDSVLIAAAMNKKRITAAVNTDRIIIKDRDARDTLELGLESFAIGGVLDNDTLSFYTGWDDKDAVKHNMADIRGYYTFIDSLGSELRFTHSEVVINDSIWSIGEDNRITFRPDYFHFQSLDFIGNTQKLAFNGVISPDPADTMRVDFRKWRLSNFDIIYGNYNFDLNGVVDGYLGLNDLFGSPNFFSNLDIKGLAMNNVLIGDAGLHSRWNEIRQSIDVLSEIIYHGNVGDSKVLSVVGSYYPERDSDNLDFLLKVNNLRLDPLGRFLDGYVSGLKGISSGSLYVKGSTADPLLTGQLKLMRTECRINYLNTKYSLSHTIDFDRNAFTIDNMIIYDTVGNTAVASGSITHTNLRDFNFDLSVKPEEFVCLNTNRYQNQSFYGSGVASGEFRFYGPLNDFHIDADVETDKGSDIVIPLNTTITVTDNDFVVFLNEEKQQDELPDEYNVELKGLSLDFNIRVNNTAEAMIYLPANMGNISSKGFGDIRFTINPRGEFNIFGDYNFLRGTFFFNFQNMINRRFEIMQGGQISFSGNPYNADVDLKALYKLKTSLSGLGANISPDLEGQRVNVNSFLLLQGKLANPEIRFSIDFPNVRDDEKQTIFAVLDTNDAALMGQQMISLLLMNSFSYASTSASMGVSSLNIISSQLSNWLSQISNDFDIGINYRSGDELTQDELEVALSTQFFDNRLTVDGNVGVVTRDNTQQQASNIVGDVNIEYKLRPDGRIRLKAFNRSNNFNSIDYNAPYTQGVGVFFTRDFDNFGDLFRRKKSKRHSKAVETIN